MARPPEVRGDRREERAGPAPERRRTRARSTEVPDPRPRECDLYGPVRDCLAAQGYTVRGEVKGCDVTAVRGDHLVVIELKREFSTSLLVQAAQRQRVADSVYVALPEPAGWRRSERWKGIQHLLRRLELGLIFVSLGKRPPGVEVVFHPLPYESRRSARGRAAVVREVAGRSGDDNVGGSARRKVATAYRESAFRIACWLAREGPLSPRQLRERGTGPKTLSILSSNFYGWFERVSYGVYALKPGAAEDLEEFPHLVSRIRAEVDAALATAEELPHDQLLHDQLLHDQLLHDQLLHHQATRTPREGKGATSLNTKTRRHEDTKEQRET